MDVAARYKDLYIGGGMYRWSFPEITEFQLNDLRRYAQDPEMIRAYHIYHDCGKPYTLVIDEQGRRHFPDHAKISTKIFRELFPADKLNALLIEQDMLCHTLKGEAAESFALTEDAPTLVLTAWAELHSNAEHLFGGLESESFKIKRKGLSKLTAKIWRARALQTRQDQF